MDAIRLLRLGLQGISDIDDDTKDLISSQSFISRFKNELLAIILFILFYFIPLDNIIQNIFGHYTGIFLVKVILFFLFFAIIRRMKFFAEI